ncbi:hypothetical protein [Luteolibacter marinus]|uniref:hypothetical protein n=1 Tax=Luteolibacter marinus TaxID=2776705 RepID=UPI001867CC31|nr:hypothetical protein [Luteolibacter marinus]
MPGNLTREELQARGLKPGEGLIVGTFRVQTFNRDGEEVNGSVSGIAIGGKGGEKGFRVSPGNFSKTDETFAIPVPAGDYELNYWSITAMGYNQTMTVSNRLPMSVPFKVNAGEAAYIGRVDAISIYGKNIIQLPVFGQGMVVITDHYDAEAGRIARDYPLVPKNRIRRTDVPKGYLSEMKRIADTPQRTIWNMFKKKSAPEG